MKIKTYRNLAALAEAVIIVGLPFLKINGESAVRFDIPTLKLHFFGKTVWMQEFFVVLLAVLFLSLLFIFITNLLGRVWCGWLCPQTVLLDLSQKTPTTRGWTGKLIPHLILVPLSLIVSASLIWYFVSPYDFFSALSGRTESHAVTWFFISIFVIVYLDLEVLGRRFCRTVCPYAKLQSTLFDKSTLVVEFDGSRAEQCMGCDKCLRVCPVGIDIRKGLQMECIACAGCIDACGSMTAQRGIRSLIRYSFGEGRIVRPKTVILFLLTVLAFLFLLFKLSALPPFAFEVFRSGELYRVTEKGEVMNIYYLIVRNTGPVDLTLGITVERPDTIRVIGPESLTVKAGGTLHQNVILLSRVRTSAEERIAFILIGPGGYEVRREGVFFSP